MAGRQEDDPRVIVTPEVMEERIKRGLDWD